MYEVYIDGKLYSKSGGDGIELINPVVVQEVNKAGSFSFTIAPNHPRYLDDLTERSIVTVRAGSENIFHGSVSEVNTDIYGQKSVKCEGCLSWLANVVLVNYDPQGKGYNKAGEFVFDAVSEYLSVIEEKEGTASPKRIIPETPSPDPYTQYPEIDSLFFPTALEAVNNIVSKYGGYVVIDSFADDNMPPSLVYTRSARRISSSVIELGLNMRTLNIIERPDIYSVIYPVGAQKNDGTRQTMGSPYYVRGDVELMQRLGWKAKVVEFEDVSSEEMLERAGRQYLEDQDLNDMIIEVGAIDLSLIAEGFSRFRLLDNVRVVSNYHGLYSMMIVTKLTYDLNNPANDTIVLGRPGIKAMSEIVGGR